MDSRNKQWHTVIIGAGQAGLATGYFLKRMNRPFIILDAGKRIGDSWRTRWETLKLFTPSQFDSLPGMPFPGGRNSYPTKDQMADYLESYAMRFSLPVQLNVRVERLLHRNGYYELRTPSEDLVADKVVVATGTNPCPFVPAVSSELSPEIFQLHSSGYVRPGLLPGGDVLVVGAATSGIEIALDTAATHRTFISGKPTFHIPDFVLNHFGDTYWKFINNFLTIDTVIGRRIRRKVLRSGSPLIRVSSDSLRKARIERLPRLTGVKNGWPSFADGSSLEVKTIIWATGYKPDFSWIEPDITGNFGWPVARRGVSAMSRGLYFVGMPFQYSLSSGLIGGVGRDAQYISGQILAD